MDSPVGDAIANVGMITTAMTCPGIIADAYLYEMCVEGKPFWESTQDIQDGYRGYYESMICGLPSTVYGIYTIPEAVSMLGESIETNGFCKTVSNMVDSTISGVKETWEDKVIKDRI